MRLLTFRHRPVQRKRIRVVVAGNYTQFAIWCQEQGVSPRGHEVVYATPDRLLGMDDVEVVRTGTWWERDDLGEIVQTLRYVNRRSE